jgi:hypothetical protein
MKTPILLSLLCSLTGVSYAKVTTLATLFLDSIKPNSTRTRANNVQKDDPLMDIPDGDYIIPCVRVDCTKICNVNHKQYNADVCLLECDNDESVSPTSLSFPFHFIHKPSFLFLMISILIVPFA